jgi:hypothetical protein
MGTAWPDRAFIMSPDGCKHISSCRGKDKLGIAKAAGYPENDKKVMNRTEAAWSQQGGNVDL